MGNKPRAGLRWTQVATVRMVHCHVPDDGSLPLVQVCVHRVRRERLRGNGDGTRRVAVPGQAA